jgi:hypothetical protein
LGRGRSRDQFLAGAVYLFDVPKKRKKFLRLGIVPKNLKSRFHDFFLFRLGDAYIFLLCWLYCRLLLKE